MRGCPAQCTYCAVPEMFGRGMRYRDAASVASEMEEVNRRFCVDFFSFLDDTFTTRKKWVRAFCDELEERNLHRRVRWICLTRPDFVSEPLLRRMREAGCARVELGIESGSEHGRKFLRKGVSKEAIIKGFDAARAAGLSTMGFCILNIPGESEEDIESTLALARRCDPDFLQVSFLTPYPGTWLWDEAQEKGWVSTEDWSRYSFLNDIVLQHGGIEPEKLQQIYLRFVRRFYLRPRTMWKLGRLVLNRTTHIRPLARTVGLGLAAAVLDRGRTA
jgi:anaerobic magnesium-protoporphyrin IX monomethyl ester cyclase